MAEFSYPFDTGNGASVTQVQWQHMAQYFDSPGVCGGTTSGFLKVTAPGTGMTVTVAPGDAFVSGFFYYSDAPITVTVAANSSGKTRADLVVLRLDTNAKTITVPAPLQGTPATLNPVPPVATYPSTVGAGVYEIPLAVIIVGSGVTAITSDKLTDIRRFTSGGSNSGYVSYTPQITDSSGSSALDSAFTKVGRYAKLSDHTVHVWGMIKATDTLVGSGTIPTLQIGLPFASANFGASADQLISVMFRGTTGGDMRTGWGCVFAGSSKMDHLAIQNKTNGDLDYMLTNAYGIGDVFQWTGTYEIAGT